MTVNDGAAGAGHRCPFCGSEDIRRHVSARDLNRGVSSHVFKTDCCRACGLFFVADPPADLATYYPSDFHSKPDAVADLGPMLDLHRSKIELVKRLVATGRLLEIGPSVGAFSHLARQADYDVSAIEMDGDCVAFLNREVGVRAVQSNDPAEVLEREAAFYDVICLWHVAEHLPQPWRTLEQSARHLRPGGVLVVATPNPLAWQAGVMGARWPHWDLPRHLQLMSIPWMTALAERCGLTVELATTCDPFSRYLNRVGWALWLQRFRMPWRVGLALASLLQFLDDREGRGSAYTMVMRRGA